MKTKITIILLLFATMVTAQDTSIVRYNLNAVDSAAVKYGFLPYFECAELNKNMNLSYKKREIKKDLLIAKIIDWEFRADETKDLKELYKRLHAVYSLDVGCTVSYQANPDIWLPEYSSFFIWVDGGYYTYFFHYKEEGKKGIYIQIINKKPIPCHVEYGISNLFDIFYFKKYIIPRLTKKVNVYGTYQNVLWEELVLEYVYD